MDGNDATRWTAADAAELEALGEEIAELGAHIDAAEHRFLTCLREFDRREGWFKQGCKSAAHWLSWRLGMSLRVAHEKVRMARALENLPQIDQAFSKGEVSYSKVRAMTRVATPDTDAALLEVARYTTGADLERVCRVYRGVDVATSTAYPTVQQRRFVRRYELESGMVRLEIQLPPVEADAVWESIASIADREARDAQRMSPKVEPSEAERSAEQGAEAEPSQAEHEPEAECSAEHEPEPEPSQAEHEAEPEHSAPERQGSREEREEALADAFIYLCEVGRKHAGESLGGAMHDLMVHIDAQRLRADGKTVAGLLENGAPLTGDVLRRLACDAACVAVIRGEEGEPLSVGRKTRTIPPSIARALRVRDGGCRFPGCQHRRHVDGHHIEHWVDGGKTSLDNLVLLCRYHHTLLHESGFSLERTDDRLVFRSPDGTEIVPVPSRGLAAPVSTDSLRAGDQRSITAETNEPRWDGEPIQMDEVIDMLIKARRTDAQKARADAEDEEPPN